MAKSTYHERKANGLCVSCAAVLPVTWPHPYCSKCRLDKNAVNRVRYIEKHTKDTKKKIEMPKSRTLDDMSIEAKRRGVSYGVLQTEETVDSIRKADLVASHLRRWGERW